MCVVFLILGLMIGCVLMRGAGIEVEETPRPLFPEGIPALPSEGEQNWQFPQYPGEAELDRIFGGGTP